ncbi:MAG: hypothetical protein ACREJO_16060 [Phycisphaerales bacterium]
MHRTKFVPRGGFVSGFVCAGVTAAALAVMLGAQQGKPGTPAAPGNPGMNTPWTQAGSTPQGAQFFVTGDNTWGTLWRLDPGAKKLTFVAHTKADFPTSAVDPNR